MRTDGDQPFYILNRHAGATLGGSFTPEAQIVLGDHQSLDLLVRLLRPKELQTLIALLCLVTPNGRVDVPVHQLSGALGIPRLAAYLRLWRLAKVSWEGRPLLLRVPHDGYASFTVSAAVLGSRTRLPELDEAKPAARHTLAGRDRVYRASRLRYSRPAKDVEAELAARHGWVLPEEYAAHDLYTKEPQPPLQGRDLQVRQRLVRLEVAYFVADDLVRTYGRERCAMQIAVLRFRNSKDPVKLLIASIIGNYEPPPVPSESR